MLAVMRNPYVSSHNDLLINCIQSSFNAVTLVVGRIQDSLNLLTGYSLEATAFHKVCLISPLVIVMVLQRPLGLDSYVSKEEIVWKDSE